jgi:hypothetical protein
VIHTRFLAEGVELRTLRGRIMIGMVLVEDLIVDVLTIALSTIGHARPFAGGCGLRLFQVLTLDRPHAWPLAWIFSSGLQPPNKKPSLVCAGKDKHTRISSVHQPGTSFGTVTGD